MFSPIQKDIKDTELFASNAAMKYFDLYINEAMATRKTMTMKTIIPKTYHKLTKQILLMK
jgi:hypothetical protein